MKYNSLNLIVPMEKREEYNKKIVALIHSGDLQGITHEEIFNLYTGKGKLHGLARNDFDNYYQFSEAKKEIEQGQFFTPHKLCEQIIRTLQPQAGFHVADLTCGIGNFFNYLPDGINIHGNELDSNAYTVCKFLYPKAILERSDFVYYTPEEKFDLVIGNPPFNLRTAKGISQYAYIEKACEVLKYGALLTIIVPASFLSDEFQDKGKIEWINEHYNFVLQSLLPTESFEAIIETKLLILQKKGIDSTEKMYASGEFTPFEPQIIYENKIAPIYEQNRNYAPKLHLLAVRDNIADTELQYQIRKQLWHIKSNPSLKEKYYSKSLARLEQLKTQLKPQHLDNKEWDKAKLTPEKINRWLIQILKNQNKLPARKEIKIVKTSYGLKRKSLSQKFAVQSMGKVSA